MSFRQRGRLYHQRGNHRQLSYSRQRTTHPKPEPLPAWEKTLCIEFNSFQGSETKIWEIYHGFPCENKLPSNAADLYIDNVDWNSKIDLELFSKIKALTEDEDGEQDNAKEIDWFSIPLEEIQATGWDEYEEPAPRLPSIVGS
ncbi:hypothetical protein J1N35_038993 [Gossypium stocksii]|uniref:Uncharacterized protein n=1 Tax=Gossypium stocksii TaxID=47602 RepID=A0A9D3UPX4_9ROSI|nr:hypothetical protein J1N35_038993 [Gossypium stocksii]